MLNITLDQAEKPIRLGDTITGIFEWQIEPERLPDLPEKFTLEVLWETDGRGNQERGVVATYPLPQKASGKQRFELSLPTSAPPSYAGTLISINWFFRLHLKTEEVGVLSSKLWRVFLPCDEKPAQTPLEVLAAEKPRAEILTSADEKYAALEKEYLEMINNDVYGPEPIRNWVGKGIKKRMQQLEPFTTPALKNATCTFVAGHSTRQKIIIYNRHLGCTPVLNSTATRSPKRSLNALSKQH